MDDLLQEFIAETRETLEALSGEIVAWEGAPGDRDRLDAIFRFVHTVKGSCGFLDLPRLARLSHAAEDALAAVRAGERTPNTELVNAVLAIVDRIGELVEAIDAGAALDDCGEDLLIAALSEGADAGLATVAQQSSSVQRNPTRSVRLSVELLDRMMLGMSDMVLARNDLARRLRDDGADPQTEAALERLSLTVAEMRDTVTRTRMQKIDALFSALPRMVRDTAAELGKSVVLHIEGSDVELDREMIEMMRDPLVHIVRNSIDHGIEDPAARRAAGKRENGRLTIAARQSGNQIVIDIADDGRGIDTDNLVRSMKAKGRRSGEDLDQLSDKARLDLIFEPGMTTKDVATTISGRGVGMDVVRANVEQIGGRIELFNTPGAGLRLSIRVPLTLSIISTIGVEIGGQRFALPRQAIEEIVSVNGDAIRLDMLGETAMAAVRDRRMPLVDLSALLGFDRQRRANALLAIVGVQGGSYALSIDGVLESEELVIKPAAPAVMASGSYAGQTLPDSGLPMLLLDCAGIAHLAGLQFQRGAVLEELVEQAIEARPSGLLFDDLDGCRRIVPLSIVDRIEQIETGAIRFSGGRLRLTVEGGIIPLIACGDWRDGTALSVLRLDDGGGDIAYAIRGAIDIVAIPEALAPATEIGPVAGVVMIDGDQVELLDAHWLFAANHVSAAREDRSTCLLAGDDSGWMGTFLRPVLESAGYRVITTLEPGAAPTVILTGAAEVPGASRGAPVIRLRRDEIAPGDDTSIYRYDRATLLAAVARAAGGRA
ncbi:MAG: chemotaxis protein CheW [Pseudomonadota bacterium]|nr:chemotaxis protein CheW [Pseudomonadota bacterium]